MQNPSDTDRVEVTAPKGRAGENSGENLTAAEHEKAAMLTEFNGTYELARFHRDRAARLRGRPD